MAAAAPPPALTPEEEAAKTDPMSGAVIGPATQPPPAGFKPTVGPSVLGIPVLPQPGEITQPAQAAPVPKQKDWNPPDPLIKEPTAKAGTKEWTPPDPLIKDQRAAQPQKGWQPPDPIINEPQAAQPQQPVPQTQAVPQGAPPQPAPAPTPAAPQPTYPAIAEDQPGPGDPHSQIAALIAQGKSPGEAQAAAAGQEPKTLSGTTPAPKPQQQVPEASDTLKAGAGSRVDPSALYGYLLGKFANSGLVGYVPPDGARWGIKTGSAAEWAAFGLAVAKQESDLNTRSYNAADPGGSAGLFQFGQGQTQFTKGGDQFDPQQSADAFVRSAQHYLADKGSIANLGETFGSIRRPNEAGQYIAGAQRVAAGGSGKDLVSSGGGGGGGGGPTGAPAAPGAPGAPGGALAGQPLFSIPTAGGGTSSSPEQQRPTFDSGGAGRESPQVGGQADAGSINLGGIVEGALLGNALRSGGGAAQQPRQRPPAQEEESPVSSLMNLPSMYVGAPLGPMKQANVLGVTTVGGPPPAPGGPALPPSQQAQLSLPAGPKALAPAAPGPIRKVALGIKSQKPAQPPAVGAPPVPPAKPPAPPARGGGAPPPQQQPSRQPPPGATPFGPPRGSTFAVPQPPGSEALKGLPLAQALKQHAALLSPDDPRVKKQADGKIKGEHFVSGDPLHEELLNGLPHGKQGRQGQILAQAEQAIGEKHPLHLSYISAPKEAALHPTRESRTIQYEEHSPEARLMGTTEGQLVGHSMIPVSVGITPSRKAGEAHQGVIHGISTNVLANNFQHVVKKLAEMGQKSPYEKLGPKFTNDLEGYLSNLNAGHVGTGQGHAVGTAEHPNSPDENHVPYHLTRREADFINTVINNTAAFAKHEDGQALRRLAEANGTLITPEGETNRMRHAIEQHEPGWRSKVLEPSIRSFKTGLIHEVHPSEEHMPATIRPGKEYRDLTQAIQRTSERGRPDVPVSVSPRSQPAATIPRDLAHNRLINEIERHFSSDKITEEEARHRLRLIGENPEEYRFVGGSGGLITPYEEDPEAITPEEHSTLKDNLRKKWIGGQMPIEDYRRKAAEVPLPSKPSPKPVATSPAAPVETPETPPAPKPAAPVPKPKPAPKPPVQPAEEPEEAPAETAPAKPPAPDEPLPTKKPATTAAARPGVKTPLEAPEPEEKLTKPAGASDKAWMKDPKNEAERQGYLEKRVAASIGRQNDHPSAIPLKVQRNEAGGVQHDPGLNPVWEKTDYNLADTPFLQKKGKGLSQLEGADKHEDTLGEDEHKHLNQVERKRLSAMRNASSVKTMGEHIAKSYNKIKDQPDIAAGKGWYSRMREKMAKVFGVGEGGKASEDHELFAQLLGATSAKTPVRDNFIQALDAFEQYKAGKFKKHIDKYKEAYSAMQDGGYKALNQKMREQGLLKEGEEPKTDAASMARWIDHHQIIPKKQNGSKYNSNSEQVLKVLAGHWLGQVKAPKTPNFAGNLTGRTLAATIDVWAARHLHRLGHEFAGEKKGWRPQSAAEPGVNSLDFAFSQDAMKHAADKIGINPDDLQAILWYAEKHHYEKNGWTGGQGAEKGSFDETWDKAFPTEGKAMTSKELQEHYKMAA